MFVLPGRHGEQPDVLDLERHFGVVGSVSLLPLVWYKQLCWLWQQGGEPFSRGNGGQQTGAGIGCKILLVARAGDILSGTLSGDNQ